MATKTFFISGRIEWCKHDKVDSYGKYTVDFYPDAEGVKIFRGSGSQWQLRQKNGEDYIKLSRKHTDIIRDEPVEFGPPVVLIATGEVVNGVPQTEPFVGKIGNGSTGTAKFIVYGDKIKGSRWEGLRIDNLIPYEGGAEREPTPDFPF